MRGFFKPLTSGPRLRPSAGFTLLELMTVVVILAIVSAFIRVGVNLLIYKARDARRLADFDMMRDALINYRAEHNTYPQEMNGGMYVVSYQSGFLHDLIPAYLGSSPKDPINDAPNPFDWFTKNAHYYGYYYYGTPAIQGVPYGCGNVTFAVLGVRWLESGMPSNAQNAYCGPPQPFVCPPWGIANVCRDWSLEYDYSTLLAD